MNFKVWWSAQTPEKQLQFKRMGFVSIGVVLCLGMYYLSGRDEKHNAPPPPKTQSISLGSRSLLEDDISAKVDKDLSKFSESLNQFQNQLSNKDEKIAALEKALSGYDEMLKVTRSESDKVLKEGTSTDTAPDAKIDLAALDNPSDKFPSKPLYPPPPSTNFVSSKALAGEAAKVQPTFTGGIGRVAGEKLEPVQAKKKTSIYMPPSFMPAVLLTGLHALTNQAGQGNPEPVLIRVQAPAQLPNSLKSNLRGCFVIANATGNLAQERVDLQLVSLTCMALDESAVIDQEIQGFVADADGVRGLAGNVVTKAGAMVSRMMIAGVFGGLGTSISSSSTSVSQSPLGSTQVVDPDKALQAGMGEGIKSGANAIQQLFLEYAKQSSPVIEVGTSKSITVVIQKGTDLKILEKA